MLAQEILMSTASVVTAEQLLKLPEDGNRYELVQGVLKMMSPAGGRHGRIAMKLALLIGQHVQAYSLGEVFAAETGFLLATNPDTVRAPDVAFVSETTLGDFRDEPGYLPVVPEFVAEVVSPNDRSSDVEEKVASWLDVGGSCVLVVDPQTKTIRRYGGANQIARYTEGEMELSPVLPGLAIDVAKLFA